MKKKTIALLLSTVMLMTSAAPAYAAEFSDGTSGTEVSNDSDSDNDSSDFTDSAPEENGFASEEGGMPAAEETIPVIDDLMSSANAASVEGDMYTINFEGELILDQTQEFVRLLNIEREKLGVPPVQIDQKMMEKAIKRAPEVAVYFAHVNPETGEPTNITYGVSAECINITHGKKPNAKEIIDSFKHSPSHWGILTDKNCTRIGAAICGVPWIKQIGNIEDNGILKPTSYTYSMVVPQVGVDWGIYEPYTQGYDNVKKMFSQKIKSEYFAGLSGENVVYEPIKVGDYYTIRPEANNGGSFYEIVSISPNGYWKTLTPNTVSVDQNGKVTGLAPGEGIVRYFLGDEFSEFLFEVTGKPKPSVKKPSTPNVTGSVFSYVNAKLSWKKISNAKGYQVYKYNSKTRKYNRIKTLSASATSFTEKLGYGKTAKYKVRAYNKASSGKTVYGNFSSVKTVKTAPAVPSVTKLSNASKRKLKLTWKRPSGAEGYVIYRKAGKNGSYKKIKTVTSAKTLSYTNSGLKKGTTYYYKIRAYRKGADKKNIYGKWSKVIVSTCR